MDQQQIVMRAPKSLRPLAETSNFPRWDEQAAEFLGFCDDVCLHGIKHPLLVTNDNRLLDGEVRRRAAIVLNMKEVPCVIVPDAEAGTIIIRELARRRHLTKGQRAYLAFPFLKRSIEEARLRAKENLHKGQQIPVADSIGDGENIEVYAKRLGFSGDLLEQAEFLHKAFVKDPKLRLSWEPLILDLEDPVGLGAAKAGMAGEKVKQDGRDMGCLNKALNGLLRQRELWESLDASGREIVKGQWKLFAADLPGTMRKALKEIL